MTVDMNPQEMKDLEVNRLEVIRPKVKVPFAF